MLTGKEISRPFGFLQRFSPARKGLFSREKRASFSWKKSEDMANSESDRILVVDDNFAHAELISRFLKRAGFLDISHAATIHELWSRLETDQFAILLLDYRLPDGTGLDVLRDIKNRNITIPVIMITGQGDERIAVEAIQQGAADYLQKSGDYLLTLPSLIQKTIQNHKLQQTVQNSLAQVHYQALLLENVHDAIVVWDPSGQITYWNQAATDLFAYNGQERLGRQVSEVYLSSFTPSITISGTEPEKPDTLRQYTRPDGKIIWIRSRLSSLHKPGDNTQIIGYMDVSHDVSEQIQAEEALRKSEARYRAIVEDYQTELICRFKPNGHLTYVNQVFCQYFGLERKKLLGMNFLYFVPNDERTKLIQHWTGFNTGKTIATLEHSVFVPHKGLRWLQRTDRAILNASGKVSEFQSVGRDITDQKRMQQQIQAAQTQLVQAARLATIGEIASGVAHQIYNPLTTIIADAQILLRKLGPNAPGRESAEAIEQAGWRLQDVVQRLLAFSEPAAETFELLSVNETIQQAISLVNEQISHAGIRLILNLSQDLPKIRGSARKLENLWVNLILLARDASENYQGQKIMIISKALPDNAVLVEIHDQGESIPADQLAAIFEPNFLGKSGGRGSGMELSICREIVRQHGGQITADSALEHDTIFRVVFPAEVSV